MWPNGAYALELLARRDIDEYGDNDEDRDDDGDDLKTKVAQWVTWEVVPWKVFLWLSLSLSLSSLCISWSEAMRWRWKRLEDKGNVDVTL